MRSEIQGRDRGDTGEIQGRYRGDIGQVRLVEVGGAEAAEGVDEGAHQRGLAW